MKKLIIGLMALVVVASSASPLLASADSIQNQESNTIDSSTIKTGESETIYENPQTGEIYTSTEVIKPASKTSVDLRSASASPISVGILWKYNTKASGTLLRNTFRKCATAEGAVGVVAAAGLETGPVDLALAALVGVGTVAFHGRFTEGANMINSHPNSGRIYMYLDHTTYGKY